MAEFSSRSKTADTLAVVTVLFGMVYVTLFLNQIIFGFGIVFLVVFGYLLWRLVVTGEAIVQTLRDSGDPPEA
jgi:hypothetical protein